MRLATVKVDGQDVCAAILSDSRIMDIAKAAQGLTGPGSRALQASTMLDLIEGGIDALRALAALVADAGRHADAMVPADAPLQAHIPIPRKNIFVLAATIQNISPKVTVPKNRMSVSPHTQFSSRSHQPRLCRPMAIFLFFQAFPKASTTKSNWLL